MKSKPSSEEELLEMISHIIPPPGEDVSAGIGDDCAVLKPSRTTNLLRLLKTDAMVEGIHYSKGTSLSQVGWKALCRPISDIAAMGGTPLYALTTVAAPSSWTTGDWSSLYKGFAKAAEKFNVSIVGGDTVRSLRSVFISVAMTGEVPRSNLKLRSGANPRDLICITGRLGGSLKSGRHLRFRPRVSEGQWLGRQSGITSMMDISDGLGSDLPKLALASGCSFRIAPDLLPRFPGCTVAEAISDGEDYERLVTVNPRIWPFLQSRWERENPGLALTPVGVMLHPDEASSPIPSAYDHLHLASK